MSRKVTNHKLSWKKLDEYQRPYLGEENAIDKIEAVQSQLGEREGVAIVNLWSIYSPRKGHIIRDVYKYLLPLVPYAREETLGFGNVYYFMLE